MAHSRLCNNVKSSNNQCLTSSLTLSSPFYNFVFRKKGILTIMKFYQGGLLPVYPKTIYWAFMWLKHCCLILVYILSYCTPKSEGISARDLNDISFLFHNNKHSYTYLNKHKLFFSFVTNILDISECQTEALAPHHSNYAHNCHDDANCTGN